MTRLAAKRHPHQLAALRAAGRLAGQLQFCSRAVNHDLANLSDVRPPLDRSENSEV
jgi:hypothetical protein